MSEQILVVTYAIAIPVAIAILRRLYLDIHKDSRSIYVWEILMWIFSVSLAPLFVLVVGAIEYTDWFLKLLKYEVGK